MLVETVRHFLSANDIAPCRLIAAVSGGVDSTALLLALADLRGDGFEILCGHVNHHLRGVEADEDETFVRELCSRLGIELEVLDGTLDPEDVRRLGVEAAAREIRTARLLSLADSTGAAYIATAHQKNDQAETIVMRLFTGSGIAGLRGIHPVRDDGFVRPLLDVSRNEIEEFLRARGITPRFDRMNADPRYLRVRVRQMLAALDDSTIANIASVAGQARTQWSILQKLIDEAEPAEADIQRDQTRFVRLPSNPWLRQAIIQRHIQRLDPTREISSSDLTRIAGSIDEIKRLSVTRNLELIRRGKTLILRRIPPESADFEETLRADEHRSIDGTDVSISIRPARAANPLSSADRRRQVIQLPAGADPLFTVRNRRDGDRFHPLGARGKKKLKAFLIDRKVPAEERGRIPIVVWNGEIVWVAGVEVSEGFKVREQPGDRYEIVVETK